MESRQTKSWRIKVFGFFILVSLIFANATTMVHAETSLAPITQWNKTYGGTSWDVAYSIVQTRDGGYALAGSTMSYGAGYLDFWLVKVDASGNPQWNKTYGGTNNEEAHSIVQTSDGGYALAGYTNSYGAGNNDFWLVKTDAAGNQQWNKTYGGINDERAYSLVPTSDEGYAIAGSSTSFGVGPENFWLVKTDSSGDQQLNKTYGKTYDQWWANSLVQTIDGGYALAGSAYSYSANNSDFCFVKTDASGDQQWNKTYGGTGSEEAYSLIRTSDGGYVLAGYCNRSYGSDNGDFWLVKTDDNGNQQWNKTYGGTNYDAIQSVVQTSDGGYALAGYYNRGYGIGGGDFWLVKTDSSGNQQWNKTYGGAYNEVAYSVVQASDGGYVIAGFTNSYGAGAADCWLIKTFAEMDIIPDFNISVLPDIQSVNPGQSATYTVTLTSSNGFSQTVSLNAGGYPAGGGLTISPGTVAPTASGATSTLTIQTGSLTPAATSTITVTGTAGAFTHSATVQLTVSPILTAFATPATLVILTGQSTTFSVTPSGGSPSYSYQWYEGTSPIADQTSSQLTITKNVVGTYNFYCKVTDSTSATANTNTVTLTTTPPNNNNNNNLVTAPTVSVFPTNKTMVTGQTAIFTVAASGGKSPYTYQWYEGSAPSPGQTTNQLSIRKTTAGSFSFYCRVTDSNGKTANSNQVTLRINTPVTISVFPSDNSVVIGQNATFFANATGGIPPYIIQWYEGTTPLPGENDNQLKITKENNGTYNFYSRVTDSSGQSADSSQAILSVNTVSIPNYINPSQIIISIVAIAIIVAAIIVRSMVAKNAKAVTYDRFVPIINDRVADKAIEKNFVNMSEKLEVLKTKYPELYNIRPSTTKKELFDKNGISIKKDH